MVLTAIVVFVAATGLVLVVGPRMARTADRLGEVTGLGGGLFGLVFLALATDLPEIALTPVAVLGGTPRLAVGNLLGSAAAQLALLALVDVAFRRGSLYQTIDVRATLGPCSLMLVVLAVPLLAAPAVGAVAGVSVGTVLLPVAYLGVLAAIRGLGRDDDQRQGEGPSATDDVAGATGQVEASGTAGLWWHFGAFALALAGAGVALEWSSERIGTSAGLAETASGALLAGVATSLPEAVTAVAAARAGALDLAVGDVVGSSALDVALLSWADVFHTEGSLFALFQPAEYALVGLALALTTLLVVGLARREAVGRGGVAVESYLMVGVYAAGVVLLVTGTGTG